MGATKDYADRVATVINKIRVKRFELSKYLKDAYGLPEHIRKARVNTEHQMTLEFKDYISTGKYDKYKLNLHEARTESEIEMDVFLISTCAEHNVDRDRIVRIVGEY